MDNSAVGSGTVDLAARGRCHLHPVLSFVPREKYGVKQAFAVSDFELFANVYCIQSVLALMVGTGHIV